MASGQRKVRISRNDLPAVASLGNNAYGYLVRHRVISEDRNRFSSWSTPTALTVYDSQNLPDQVAGSISLVGSSFLIVWDDVGLERAYDIFVSFDSGATWSYHGISPIHTYSVIDTAGSGTIDVAVQVEGIDKVRASVLTVFEGSVI